MTLTGAAALNATGNGGANMYEVRSLEEAIEWSRRFMQIHLDTWPGFEGTSVVRQVFGPDMEG